MTLDQKRFQRSPDIAPVVDTNPFQGADCVEQSAVVHVQARLTEQPAKQQEVINEGFGHHEDAEG